MADSDPVARPQISRYIETAGFGFFFFYICAVFVFTNVIA